MLQQDSSILQDGELLGVQSFSEPVMTTAQSVTELALRFFINLIVCFIIVRCLYYPKRGRKDYVFTFISFSSAMLLLLCTMGRVDVGVGLTLGLFAIFGVIRYRTETVPVREMTYLFMIIALAAINGLAPLYSVTGLEGDNPHYVLRGGNLLIILLANAAFLALIWILEGAKALRSAETKIIQYDRIDLIQPSKRQELLDDLEKRLGIRPEKVEIGNVDFLKDSAYIKIYYHLPEGSSPSSIGNVVRQKQFYESQEF